MNEQTNELRKKQQKVKYFLNLSFVFRSGWQIWRAADKKMTKMTKKVFFCNLKDVSVVKMVLAVFVFSFVGSTIRTGVNAQR